MHLWNIFNIYILETIKFNWNNERIYWWGGRDQFLYFRFRVYKTMDIVLPPSNCSHLWCHFLFDKYTLSIENITNSFKIKFKIRMSLCWCAAPGEHPHHFRVFPDHVITWPPRKVWTLVNDCSCPNIIFLFFFRHTVARQTTADWKWRKRIRGYSLRLLIAKFLLNCCTSRILTLKQKNYGS